MSEQIAKQRATRSSAHLKDFVVDFHLRALTPATIDTVRS